MLQKGWHGMSRIANKHEILSGELVLQDVE